MPERFSGEWQTVKLGECGKFINGNGFPLAYQGKLTGTYPFYKVSDMNNEGNEFYMSRANNYVSYDIAKTLSCKIIPSDSIVFAKIGAAIFLERKRVTTCDCCIDNNMMAFLPNSDISSVFMCFVMQRIKFGKLAHTTALPSLTKKNLSGIRISLPPLDEQIAIAQTLSAFDRHLANLSELIAKHEGIRAGALEDLLSGRTRLPGFSGAWRTVKLGQVGKWGAGSTPSRSNPAYWLNGRIFWVTNGDLNDYVITSTKEKITDEALNIVGLKLKKPGAVVIGTYGTIGTVAVLNIPAAINQNCCACEVCEEFHNLFIFYALMYHRAQLKSIASYGAVPHLSKQLLTNYSISVPPIDEQIAIAQTLSALDLNITNLKAEHAKISALRIAAINDLLTGTTRLERRH